jgi:hypothetical protein
MPLNNDQMNKVRAHFRLNGVVLNRVYCGVVHGWKGAEMVPPRLWMREAERIPKSRPCRWSSSRATTAGTSHCSTLGPSVYSAARDGALLRNTVRNAGGVEARDMKSGTLLG